MPSCFGITALATSVVIFCLCAELAALAAYYVETGGLFYTSRRTLYLDSGRSIEDPPIR